MQAEALRRVRAYKDPLFVETRAETRIAHRIGAKADEHELTVAQDESLFAARGNRAAFSAIDDGRP